MIAWLRRIARGESNLDVAGHMRLWAAISAALILLSLVGLFVRHLNLGIEFEGGTSLTVPMRTAGSPAQLSERIEEALSPLSLGEVRVQIQTTREGEQQALVRTPHIEDRGKLVQAQTKLADAAGQVVAGKPNPDAVSIQDVGASWGRSVSNKALRGLIVFVILVTLYISFRFEPKMAIGAVIAVFHDLLITAGLYALIGFEVSPATVIALLTLLGYSLYDTVVVFDRLAENTSGTGGRVPFAEVANRSVNEVLMRSINTSLSTLLPIGGLLFVGVLLFGAVTLKDLSLAMFIGTLVSTYSSIFVATPIFIALKEREPRYRAMAARAATGDRLERRPALRDEPKEEVEVDPLARIGPVRPSGASMRVHRPAPRPRRQKKKRGKRR